MFAQMNIKEFVRQLSDGNPTPGGGSAAALAGAMGSALVAMFCNLTAGKKKYADVKEEMAAVAVFAQELQEQLLELVDRDSAAYDRIVAANRLPRETEAERTSRLQAIDDATLEATRTPLETAAICVNLLERIPPLAAKGNPNAISDLKVGTELLSTAFIGARANVEINLPWLAEPVAAPIKAELAELSQRAERSVQSGREEISRQMS
mgnify:CR=1 FL=1|jgi:glutamate formiminotransferase/formiminotetrahydrofolate cyclodeaminase